MRKLFEIFFTTIINFRFRQLPCFKCYKVKNQTFLFGNQKHCMYICYTINSKNYFYDW